MKAIDKITQKEYEITGSVSVMHDDGLYIHYSVVSGEDVFTIEINDESSYYII